jgi:hyperosmotically inducible protein
MIMKVTTYCASVAISALVFGGAVQAQRSAGEHVDDSTLIASTKMALIEDRAIPGGKINVEAFKRTVQLSGFVDNEAEKAAALARAKSVAGVEKVNDAIIVASAKRTFGQTIDDQTVHAAVKLKLAEVFGVGKAVEVVEHVRDGEVLLSGFVDSTKLRADVVAAVKSVKGVTTVHDKISVKS